MELVIEIKNKGQDGHAWKPAAKAHSAQEALDYQNYSRQYAPDVQVRVRRPGLALNTGGLRNATLS